MSLQGVLILVWDHHNRVSIERRHMPEKTFLSQTQFPQNAPKNLYIQEERPQQADADLCH